MITLNFSIISLFKFICLALPLSIMLWIVVGYLVIMFIKFVRGE